MLSLYAKTCIVSLPYLNLISYSIFFRFSKCKLESVTTCVLDSEAVAWDREKKQIQPFQVLSTRKRKDADQSEIKVQVAVFAFDLLVSTHNNFEL